MQPSIINSFAIIPTLPEEIVNVSPSIRLTHSKGVDDIGPYIDTPCIASVAWPLSEIINCSFKIGIVPNAIKIAKVVPIFKKGERDNITNK